MICVSKQYIAAILHILFCKKKKNNIILTINSKIDIIVVALFVCFCVIFYGDRIRPIVSEVM